MTSIWTLNVDEHNIARLTFDLPGEKVNKFTAAAMAELETVLDGSLPTARALLVTSGKPGCFVVGADIDELTQLDGEADARAKAEAGKRVFDKLAALPVPTVAVIDGPCLGGGLEFALACRYRVVTDDEKTSLGLPEVNLGIIPGWGGTQRLPRLIGLPQALKLILAGKPVDARRAVKLGLADAIAGRPFLDDAARGLVDEVLAKRGRRDVLKRRRRRRSKLMRLLARTALGRRLVLRQARKQVMSRTKGHYPAPLAALEVIRRTAGHRDPKAGAAIETDAFARLACTPISRNLVWLFQAGRRLKKSAGRAEPVRRAGVAGAGIMGSGIAWAFARAGIPVRMRDVSWDALARGMAAAAASFKALVKRRKLTRAEMNLAMHRIGPSVDLTGFAGSDVVVEAVAEDMGIKKQVLADLEKVVGRDAIICTNTSSLSLEEMAGALERPERFLGLHFFNPVPRMPLVEVVPGRRTTPEAVAAAADLVRALGKTPMVVGDCAGFLVNRILLPYLVESAWMFEEGVEARRLDGLLERFGMPMGPLALIDEVGLDVGYKVARVLEDAYGPRMRVPEALGAIAAAGDCLGRKTGCGFYVYRGKRRKPNKRVERLARDARRADGVEARELTDEQIVDRAVLIMVNEASRCLDEGVVADAESLDMAMVLGTGFAPFRGGLLRYADDRGTGEVKSRLDELAERFGERFRPGELLERLAAEGGRFHDRGAGRAAAPQDKQVETSAA